MDAKIIKDIAVAAGKYVPSLAGWLLGPMGSVGVSLLESLFGVSSDKLSSIISNDSTAGEKLSGFAETHKELIAHYQLEGFQAEVQDRESAREREEKITAVTGKRDFIMEGIAITVIVGFFVMCILTSITALDKSDHDILYMLIGQLTSGFIMVLSYYFGSSNTRAR